MFKKFLTMGLTLTLAVGVAACGSGEETNEDATVGERLDYEIIGIDPGAGLMKATAQVLEDYELTDWELVEGSGAAMTAALKKAYNNEEPIVVTGWTPHWMFSKFDLKYLEDPKGIYGEDESIHTLVRNGLKEDLPGVHQVLDQFNWTSDDMGEVMVMNEDGMSSEESAAQWVADHADMVAEWTDGAAKGNGEEVTIAFVAWASEIASTHVIGQVLMDHGYDVTLRQVEVGPMFAGVADGSVDALVAAWLPITHADHYSTFEGDFEDLGANLVGTKVGLVVPSYMDIDSIEDLKSE
ncbi:glycine betaine ABC transporter substrate-binding protein [Longirhabdus pacifica]|uniref:glycine betaine ABC transporter substrate-binding protein n=1 Tax=Longirhabdus pacifica TaxID=2305227 RepID=UPI001008AF95|nr:glycine betaine ABC transporter substrate-binding protein [Longirhabdus pacifica]